MECSTCSTIQLQNLKSAGSWIAHFFELSEILLRFPSKRRHINGETSNAGSVLVGRAGDGVPGRLATACRKECVTKVAVKRSCRGRAGEAWRGRAEGVTSAPCLRSKQTSQHANKNQAPIHQGAKAPPATPRETKAEPSHVKELPMCNNGQNSGAFMSHVSFACSSRIRT